jgi:hypothetical protein
LAETGGLCGMRDTTSARLAQVGQGKCPYSHRKNNAGIGSAKRGCPDASFRSDCPIIRLRRSRGKKTPPWSRNIHSSSQGKLNKPKGPKANGSARSRSYDWRAEVLRRPRTSGSRSSPLQGAISSSGYTSRADMSSSAGNSCRVLTCNRKAKKIKVRKENKITLDVFQSLPQKKGEGSLCRQNSNAFCLRLDF